MKFDKSMKPGTFEVITPGTAFDHTKEVMKAMAEKDHDFVDMLAAMLHDIGKPISYAKNGLRKGFPNVLDHEETGRVEAKRICSEMRLSKEEAKAVEFLVGHHMQAHKLIERKHKSAIIPILKHPCFERLVKLADSDSEGSFPTVEMDYLPLSEVIKHGIYKEVIEAPRPKEILTGQDLIEAGFAPSAKFGKALKSAYKIQVDSGETRKDVLLNAVKSILK